MLGQGSKLGHGRKEGAESGEVTTSIGRQSRVEGDIHFSGKLLLDGEVKGNIIAVEGSKSVLTVSEHGSIEGDVQVSHIILNGTVNGDVRSGERIELASNLQIHSSELGQEGGR